MYDAPMKNSPPSAPMMVEYGYPVRHPGFWAILFLLFALFSSFESEARTSSPVPVEVGIRLHQVVDIDQKKENFTVVITLKARWKDPLLAYEPAMNKDFMMLNKKSFKALMLQKRAHYPAVVVLNQQGTNRIHNSLVSITPDGVVSYLERTTMVLQANKFNFRFFPFDTQLFEIQIDCLLPEDQFVFKELEGYSGMDDKLGEAEWLISGFSTRITSTTDTTGLPGSRLTLDFTGKRHYVYYVTKIFVPVTLIVIVSWFSFFLKDYSKRIDLAGANLLLFIAFNFTISGELPKLGYITFLDAFLVSTFVITSIVVLINVLLKRMQNHGHHEVAESIDRYALWAYPMTYLIGSCIITAFFFIEA